MKNLLLAVFPTVYFVGMIFWLTSTGLTNFLIASIISLVSFGLIWVTYHFVGKQLDKSRNSAPKEKSGRDFMFWLKKSPTILKFIWKDFVNFYDAIAFGKSWLISVIVVWILFAVAAALTGWTQLPLSVTIAVVQLVLQFALMIGMAIIQFVAIFWFMSQSRTTIITPNSPKVNTFDDYAGQERLVATVKNWLEIMKNPQAFQKMGGNLIKGLLLYGEPGTGKSLLAKCMAGEGKGAFLGMEGSGFRGMFWGVDTMKVIAFVKKARKLAQEWGFCIAYIDEIDAIAQSRGGVQGGQQGGMGMGGGMFGGMGSGALTRLLYEMDGLDENVGWKEKFQNKWRERLGIPKPPRNWHIMFMGSTNRVGILDPAILRPGRMDHKEEVTFPDREGRKAIFNLYLGKVKHQNINVDALVHQTPRQTTPAMIMAAITKDAVRDAIVNGRDYVTQIDIEKGILRELMGSEKNIELPKEQEKQVAYHEAGHTVAEHVIRPEKVILQTSIIARQNALGFMWSTDEEEVWAKKLQDLVDDIPVALAGDVATRIWFKQKGWTGPTGDFAQTRHILRQLYMQGYFGFPYSEVAFNTDIDKFPSKVFAQIQKLMTTQRKRTEKILTEHWAEVEAVANLLLEKKSVPGPELVAVMDRVAAEQAAGGVK